MYGTRTLLELSVGKTHTIEVLIHLRTNDLEWWNCDFTRHKEQLIKLISRRILPLECRDEIESYRATRTNRDCGNQRGELQGKAVLTLGVTNAHVVGARRKKRHLQGEATSHHPKRKTRTVNEHTKKQVAKMGVANTKPRTNALKSSSLSTVSSKEISYSKKKVQSSMMKTQETIVTTKEKNDANNGRSYASGLDIKFAFSDDDIQVTYKVKSLKTMYSATLSYHTVCNTSNCDGDSHNNSAAVPLGKGVKQLSSFRRLQKLPKQIIMWCYPFDPLNPKELTLKEGGGFPRPEMIPISGLFSDNRYSEASL